MRMELLDPRAWLNGVLADFNCQTGTLHRVDEAGRILGMVTQVGLPAFLADRVRTVPVGAGITGVAAKQGVILEPHDLQSGGADASPTGVSGALAVPVFSKESGALIGVLGLGMIEPHRFSEEEKARATAVAESIAVWLEEQSLPQ